MASTDRLLTALETLVHALTRRASILGRFPSKIVGQAGNLTLEVKPDPTDPDGSTSVPGTSGIPIRYGLPGFTAKVPIGTRGALEYENGDPGRPVVTAWEAGAVDEVTFDNGTKAVARVDDTTAGGTLIIAFADVGPTRVYTYTYTPSIPPGGAPTIWVITYPLAATAPVMVPNPVTVSFLGKITSGNPKLLA